MGERIYKTLGLSGTWSLILGISSVVIGVSVGVLLIIGGAKLLQEKKHITF